MYSYLVTLIQQFSAKRLLILQGFLKGGKLELKLTSMASCAGNISHTKYRFRVKHEKDWKLTGCGDYFFCLLKRDG
jgi:hypothetical protein